MTSRRRTTGTQISSRTAMHGENLWGRQTIPGIRHLVSATDVRQHARDEETLVHRPKNGVYDPVTYYHLVDFVTQMAPDTAVRSAELKTALQSEKPQFVWDSTTVGRIMSDVAEELAGSFAPNRPIRAIKQWNGMTYQISSAPEDRAMLINLVKDLRILAADAITRELLGEVHKRTQSPLVGCPSLLTSAVSA